MKKLLILFLIGICALAWRSEAIMRTIGLQDLARYAQPTADEATTAQDQAKHKGMTVHEYARLAKTDPNAYRKFMQSHQQKQERSAVDKLMNFFARGKYE